MILIWHDEEAETEQNFHKILSDEMDDTDTGSCSQDVHEENSLENTKHKLENFKK